MEYTGNCINSFDEDGKQNRLGRYQDSTEFAQGVERSQFLNEKEFFNLTNISPKNIKDFIEDYDSRLNEYILDEDTNIVMIYNIEHDIHHFFELSEEDILINKFKNELIQNVPGFNQFQNAPEGSIRAVSNGHRTGEPNTKSIYIQLNKFDDIDISKLNPKTFDTVKELPSFNNVHGNVTFGSPEGITILFSAIPKNDRTLTKSVRGNFNPSVEF